MRKPHHHLLRTRRLRGKAPSSYRLSGSGFKARDPGRGIFEEHLSGQDSELVSSVPRQRQNNPTSMDCKQQRPGSSRWAANQSDHIWSRDLDRSVPGERARIARNQTAPLCKHQVVDHIRPDDLVRSVSSRSLRRQRAGGAGTYSLTGIWRYGPGNALVWSVEHARRDLHQGRNQSEMQYHKRRNSR